MWLPIIVVRADISISAYIIMPMVAADLFEVMQVGGLARLPRSVRDTFPPLYHVVGEVTNKRPGRLTKLVQSRHWLRLQRIIRAPSHTSLHRIIFVVAARFDPCGWWEITHTRYVVNTIPR